MNASVTILYAGSSLIDTGGALRLIARQYDGGSGSPGTFFGFLSIKAMDIENCTNLVAVEQLRCLSITLLDESVSLPIFELSRSRHSQGELVNL